MLEEKLTNEELEWMEVFFDPHGMAECLFSNADNLALFIEEDYLGLRLYQLPMLSWENAIFIDLPGLTDKEKMALREGAGNIYQFGGRGYGKTWTVEKLDTCEYVIYAENEEAGFSSFDMMHIRGVLEVIIKALEYHPILNLFKKGINRGLNYRITTRTGVTIESVNMNIADGKRAGDQFFQKHFKRLWIEEASKETKVVSEKRAESRHELGCVAKNSKILLSDLKTKNIEDIEIGDEILAYDEQKNQTTKAKVLNVICQGKKDVIKINSDTGKELWLTPDHKIRVLSEGYRIYRWNEAIKCSLKNYKVQTLNYINNLEDYYKGILWGLIESDGRLAVDDNNHTQIKLYQAESCEYEFIKLLLNKLCISFTDYKQENNRFKDSYKRSPLHLIHIKTENNQKIFGWNLELHKFENKDLMYGFIAGFILGDGYVCGKRGSLHITQSRKINSQKIDFIIKILEKLKVNFNIYENEKKQNVQIDLSKYAIPFSLIETTKGKKYLDKIYNVKRFYWQKDSENIRLDGFEKNIECYDLTTTTGNFICNGFIVHNCVERIAGMTNFTKVSPAGKMFFENERPAQVLNLPQYVNPNYDEREEKRAVKKYNGKQSVGFRVFVDGDVIQDGISALDMQRISELCYPRKKDGTLDENVTIKNIEVDKKNFGMYRALCVVDKPQHVDRLIIASDVGEIGGTTEIIIMAEINDKWRYLYNITVRNLPEKDSYLIFKYLYQRLNPNYVALDCTGGSPGRGVYGYLETDPEIDTSKLIWVDFGEKIEVGIELDANNKPILENGKTLKKFENTTIWSVERLCHLLYEAQVFLPLDYKLDEQLNAVVAIIRGNSISYECATDENHLWQAFQVFAVAQWKIEYEGFSKPEQITNRHCNAGA